MSIKKIIPFIFLLFHLTFIFAQEVETKNFTLKWKDNYAIQINKGKDITIPLVENNFFDKYNNPTYATNFKVQKNTFVQDYNIKNIKFSVLNEISAKDLNKTNIPTEVKSEFTISKARNESIAILSVSPLINDNGQIKKITSFTLEYTLTTNKVHAKNTNFAKPTLFTNNSVLANGTWYKFSIDTTGVFKIDKNLLEQIGINTNNLDPKNIKIYGNGGNLLPQINSSFRYDDLQENTLYIEGESDGVFNDDDFILFYAKGPHSWDIDTSNHSNSKHINNIYSDNAYYFITADNGIGKRIQIKNKVDQNADQQINTFQAQLVHEVDTRNLFANGQQWLGEDFSNNNTQNFNFNFDNIDNTQEITVRVRGAAISFARSTMEVRVNRKNLMTLNFRELSGFNLATVDIETENVISETSNINLQIFYNNQGNPSAKAYLDYIEILGTKKLTANNKQFSFKNILADDPNLVYEYTIQNNTNIFQLWDITDYINPKQINNESNNASFSFKDFGGDAKNYIVLNSNNFYTPKALQDGKIENQNLHQLKDIDYLIVTRDYLTSEAERLAKHHRENSNLNTIVVPLNQIYNEFGSGSPDLTAIRDFIHFLYLTASSDDKKIKYACFFGDTSFDFKDRISGNTNIVPAFQSYESFNLVSSYVTDDYFGMMGENEGGLSGSDLQDVACGRFPIVSTLEAKQTIDKALNYNNINSFGDWRNSITFVADDPDTPSEFILQEAVDQLAEDVKTNKPIFNLKKIYSDAHQQETSAGGERYPTVNEAISNSVETGTLIVDYFGHGGINGWAGERILEVPQIQAWNNPNTLPLFITVTCEFTKYDNPLQPSAGEFTFLNKNGGVTSLISTTREIFISTGQLFNKTLIEKLLKFNDENYTIAEALMYSKHSFSTNQRFFVYYFGDPAMRLAQPEPNIVITKINDKDFLQTKDTLKALSHIKIEGIVTDQNNQFLSNYNGILATTIYDKAIDKSTLDNNNFGRKMEFTAVESKIFKGRASVKDGKFTFDFIVPKDIRIAFGNAKISFYANNTSIDKSGYNLDVIIGGINENAPADNEGPNIDLYINDENFVDGGNTNQSPILYAVLEDLSGINTSITAVDHDIIVILDNDNANPIILNDFYETELNDFKKGKVKFPFRNLEPGLHHIKFKCWDTYNNPSESTLSFTVVDNSDLVLSNVLNYPNPFVNYTEFWFNHNKPNETLEVQIQIFTISGKLIKTLNQSVQSTGLLSREISWDGLDDFGNKIGKGVYVYKLRVKSLLSNTKSEVFEKLVILQ